MLLDRRNYNIIQIARFISLGRLGIIDNPVPVNDKFVGGLKQLQCRLPDCRWIRAYFLTPRNFGLADKLAAFVLG